MEELRKAMLAYRFSSEAEEQTREPDGSLIELAEPFVCAETEGDEVCNKRFANYRQLMTHETRKHGIRTVLGLLTRTTECPWCRSRFVDRETALHHLYNATEEKTKCYIKFSGWHHLLIPPEDLELRILARAFAPRGSARVRQQLCWADGGCPRERCLNGRKAARETASWPRVEARAR